MNNMQKEIKPIGMNLFIQPYAENPYKQSVSSGGLQLLDGEFNNPDTGEIDKKTEGIKCGLVLEVGEGCKNVKVGDDVFYYAHITTPIPFMGKGFLLTNEPNILAYIR